jgi:hypothetical protein
MQSLDQAEAFEHVRVGEVVVRRHDQAVDDSMQYAERRDLEVLGERQRTDREHLIIACAVDVGQDEDVLMAQLRAPHEPPPDAVMTAVRAIEPSEPQRVITHRRVDASEHPFEIALVEGVYPARHDRVTRRRRRGPEALSHRGHCSTVNELALGVIVNPQRGQSKSIIPAPLKTGSRVE